MTDRKILLIHPKDKTTAFLDRIKNHIVQRFEDEVHQFNIHPNDDSHNVCLQRIKDHSEDGLIIFMGHGHIDSLSGSKGDLYDNKDLVSAEAILEAPDKYYYKDIFIGQDNAEVFRGKKVFCLACNSNNKIAEYALEKGAKAFYGFGNIPTSEGEFKQDGLRNVSNDIVKAMKTELNAVIKKALEYSISNNYSFTELRSITHFMLNQRITFLLREEKHLNERHLLADYLYSLKKEMKILGDNKLKLLS